MRLGIGRGTLLSVAIIVGATWLATRDPVRSYITTALALDEKPAAEIEQLSLEGVIPLGAVKGRIDHLAMDLGRKRLFVAELGNNSLAVVDLAAGKLERRLNGLKEPQGVAFSEKTNKLFIANGGDGTVAIVSGGELARTGEISLGEDADNIRIDRAGNIIVGYGAGALAVLDPATGAKIANIPLAAHPESFQIAPDGRRIFVNEPRALRVGVIDRASGQEIAKWTVPGAVGNFPMALDAAGDRLFVVYRMPALIAAFDVRTGEDAGRSLTCRDADDLFHDEARRRVYVICGEGAIAVLDAISLREAARLRTRDGARTGFFSPELDRLFVAAPARDGEAAEIRVYRPR
ncbi:YncE family protein [Rhodoblastus sp.]|uniref:YncE family protein n=1 Tax=Rhodoblastus sp. TaxID=1962975 RepID=UPI0035B49096